MDATRDKVVIAQMRAYEGNGMDVSNERFFRRSLLVEAGSRPVPDHVRRKAMDAIDNMGTRGQIRLIDEKGSLSPMVSISPGLTPITHHKGHQSHLAMPEMAQDDFGRDCA